MTTRRVTGRWAAQQKVQAPVETPAPPAQPAQPEVYVKTQPVDYYSTNDDTVMADATNGDAGEKTGYWKKKRLADGGRVVKKKKDPNSLNKRLKKYVQPKNAAMCLNELVGNLTYTTEVDGVGDQPTCICVVVGGQEFRGYGSSKQLAKQAAAEAALVSFVKSPKTGTEEAANGNVFAGEGSAEPDNTPWAILASFAMFKLFNDWREGRVGVCSSSSSAFNAMSMETAASQALLASKPAKVNPKVAAAKLAAAQKAAAEAKVGVQKPAKALPTKAVEMHPVMLLHQMRPTATFQTSTVKNCSRVSSIIDEKKFEGEGTNAKKAKLQLAIAANTDLFGVVTSWQDPSQ